MDQIVNQGGVGKSFEEQKKIMDQKKGDNKMEPIVNKAGVGKSFEDKEQIQEPKKGDLTTCGLCQKDLFSPKNFPCLHSFCEMCIVEYVKIYKREKKTKGITPTVVCPTCETPASFRSVDNPKEFAESLQTSTLVTSLLSRRAEKTRDCNLCPSVEKKQGRYWCFHCAQALCDDHESYHRAVTSSKIKHPVYPVKDLRSIPDTLYKSQPCRFHEKNPVAHFCMDHLTACCSVCWKRMHRTCNVIPIDQAARIVHKSRITLDLEHKIDYLLVKVENTLQERKDLLLNIEKQRKNARKSVKTFRKQLDHYIDSLQQNLEHDVEQHFSQIKEQLEKEIYDFTNKRSNFKHYQKIIKSISEFSQPIQALSELTDIRQQCGEIEEFVGRSLFEMKNFRLSVSFISIQQIAHVISKFGTTVITETFRRLNSHRSPTNMNRSRSESHNSLASSRRSKVH